MKTFSRDVLTTLIMAVVIFLGLQATVSSPIVEGPSMLPSFHHGQRLLVNKAIYQFFHPPERGDVIILRPEDEEDDLIKRVIGLPGEYVEIKDGTVYIHRSDGSVLKLDEAYIAEPTDRPFEGETIPENEYFVLGDNRNHSGDSRLGWTLPRERIVGKVWLSIWPPELWGLVEDYSYQESAEGD